MSRCSQQKARATRVSCLYRWSRARRGNDSFSHLRVTGLTAHGPRAPTLSESIYPLTCTWKSRVCIKLAMLISRHGHFSVTKVACDTHKIDTTHIIFKSDTNHSASIFTLSGWTIQLCARGLQAQRVWFSRPIKAINFLSAII